MVEPRQNTTNAVRVLILLALAMAGAVVTGILGLVVTIAKVNIMWTIVLQDVLVFILPAILLAMICYEEFFFRGALMGIMRRGRANIHVVIWTVAIIFSAIHFQFFGFVPRMLLGAWFGYLLVWTRSLWVPVIAHALNNGAVTVFQWMDSNHYVDGSALEQLGVPADGQFPWLALASTVATILSIVVAKRVFSKKNKQNA